jgi:6-hydroxytryprostatin B O-methyltransferase
MAITSNFLCEPTPDNVAHNAVSATFVTSPSLVGWAKFMTEFSMPTAASFVEATEKWGVTDKKNETAFNVATKTSGPLFEFFAQSPDLAHCFASYMKSVQASYATSLKHLLTGYNWAGLCEAVVVDVCFSQYTSIFSTQLTVHIGRRLYLQFRGRTSRRIS